MDFMKLGGAMALSLLVAACGEKQNAGLENHRGQNASPATAQAGQAYSGSGEVTAIVGDQVTISHGPIEGIGWPAMAMTFRTGSPEMAQGVNVGDRVSFSFRPDGGAYVVTSLSREP